MKIQIEKEMKENLFITIGEEVSNINKINYSYESAKDLMNKKYLYLNQGIIYKDKIKNNINSSCSFLNVFAAVNILLYKPTTIPIGIANNMLSIIHLNTFFINI